MSDKIDIGKALSNILAGRDARTGEKPPPSDAEIANLAGDLYRAYMAYQESLERRRKVEEPYESYVTIRDAMDKARITLLAAVARRPDLIG